MCEDASHPTATCEDASHPTATCEDASHPTATCEDASHPTATCEDASHPTATCEDASHPTATCEDASHPTATCEDSSHPTATCEDACLQRKCTNFCRLEGACGLNARCSMVDNERLPTRKTSEVIPKFFSASKDCEPTQTSQDGVCDLTEKSHQGLCLESAPRLRPVWTISARTLCANSETCGPNASLRTPRPVHLRGRVHSNPQPQRQPCEESDTLHLQCRVSTRCGGLFPGHLSPCAPSLFPRGCRPSQRTLCLGGVSQPTYLEDADCRNSQRRNLPSQDLRSDMDRRSDQKWQNAACVNPCDFPMRNECQLRFQRRTPTVSADTPSETPMLNGNVRSGGRGSELCSTEGLIRQRRDLRRNLRPVWGTSAGVLEDPCGREPVVYQCHATSPGATSASAQKEPSGTPSRRAVSDWPHWFLGFVPLLVRSTPLSPSSSSQAVSSPTVALRACFGASTRARELRALHQAFCSATPGSWARLQMSLSVASGWSTPATRSTPTARSVNPAVTDASGSLCPTARTCPTNRASTGSALPALMHTWYTQAQCKSHTDCEAAKACVDQECVNPCLQPHACGLNAQCRVEDHQAKCQCPLG
ncbi:unnamed protein product [Cyprideis torosa]|uniref:Uncharacterized protein n=1 Tax=Cyprideis torosa TaxID=163714 RepID=A0A7R8WI93_9CRUS|nr:unnamed protein product [Cyprideis torosa]CAG0900414.1 unnamed protein product [Cyprideis torosa]